MDPWLNTCLEWHQQEKEAQFHKRDEPRRVIAHCNIVKAIGTTLLLKSHLPRAERLIAPETSTSWWVISTAAPVRASC